MCDEREENLSEGSISDDGGYNKGNMHKAKARILEIIEERPSRDV